MTQGRWIELRDTEQGKVMVDLSWLPVTGDREVIRWRLSQGFGICQR